VRFGDRKQNSFSKQTQPVPRRPATSRDANAKHADGSDATPMSAARLAAEAAFAAPPLFSTPSPTQSTSALVTVRRARGTALAPAADEETDTAGESGHASSPVKGPRVFRVDAPVLVATAADASRQPSTWQADEAVPISSSPIWPTAPRLRRSSTHKRPGPVLHVVHALPPRQELPLLPLLALTAQLARVEPVLADIRFAQALRLMDNNQASEWQRLGRVADDIRQALQTMLR
jgi:hypothetical protein